MPFGVPDPPERLAVSLNVAEIPAVPLAGLAVVEIVALTLFTSKHSEDTPEPLVLSEDPT